jgi:hypothetical protein
VIVRQGGRAHWRWVVGCGQVGDETMASDSNSSAWRCTNRGPPSAFEQLLSQWPIQLLPLRRYSHECCGRLLVFMIHERWQLSAIVGWDS